MLSSGFKGLPKTTGGREGNGGVFCRAAVLPVRSGGLLVKVDHDGGKPLFGSSNRRIDGRRSFAGPPF
jgi:hypothetical protein